ncbi:MAG: Stk1 family PASTA domain-containing Ser/Thr kinase [Candidatus Baltobacteraceae bacterium]
MIERILSERYRLDRKLGEGGMAIVYGGTDTLLRRRVAIKVLRPQFAADGEFVRRFYHEAEAVAKLAYPNIVSVYDVGRQDDTYYIVMELVDGATLAEIIDHDGRLPETVAIDFAEQICRGLAYAHRQGILHRDIKPANILITKDDVVKLSDFGIARAVTTQTMTMTVPGMVMGSVYYLSPEQAQGHELGAPSDLYSLGVVMYQMLVGRLPYTGESPITVALKHVSSPPPAIEVSDGSVSPALAAIVRRLLQKAPEDRYASATELAAALREAREHPQLAMPMPAPRGRGERPPNRPGPPPPRPSPAPDRREGMERVWGRTLWLVAGLTALLVVAAIAGYLAFNRRAGPFAGPTAVPVPNVVGRSIAEAERALDAAGLAYALTPQASETVPKGRIVKQNPAPPAALAARAIVQLVASSGLPTVNLTDLRAFSRDDAERYVRDQKLSLRVVEQFDAAPQGTVLSQRPAPGSLPIHSTVTLVVSKGKAPVIVPSVVSLDAQSATALLARRGLRGVIGQRTASDNIPANVITSQDPAPGASVDSGSQVSIDVSTGPAGVAVPDVAGQDVDRAVAALHSAGLTPAYRYSLQPGDPLGAVIDSSPAGGSQAKRGSIVTLTIVVSGTVPDVAGMELDRAKQILLHSGYQIGNTALTQNGSDGRVYATEPASGALLRPGETVTIYFNSTTGGASGPQPTPAPSESPAPSPAPSAS